MGAGGSIPDVVQSGRGDAGANQLLYLQVERLSKSGYFQSHQAEYESAVRDAIEKEALDIVELLLVAGNARLMDPGPVHIAAELGKLDALELLDSAGFDLHRADSQGNTPMHCAARDKRNMGCANVGTFLALRGGKRLCRARSVDGSTCMHVAAEHNNAAFIEGVLSCIGSVQSIKDYVAMPNFDKKSALDIAERRGKSHTETSMTFHQFVTTGASGRNTRANLTPVDPERMMAVWDAFFENAMKRMMSDEMAVDGGLMVDDRGYAKAAGAMLTTPYYTENDFRSTRTADVSRSHVTYDEEALGKVESILVSWFEWTMLHYTDETSETEMHYLVNKNDGRTVWLTDHIRDNSVSHGGLVAAADFTQLTAAQRREVAVVPHGPSGMQVTECVRNGWVQYFDSLSNSLLWLNAFTWTCKETLPLGGDPVLKATRLPIITSGLSDYFNGRDLAPDPAVSAAWVMVVYEEEVEEKEEQERGYFPTAEKGKGKGKGGGVWDIWDEGDNGIYQHHKSGARSVDQTYSHTTSGAGEESKYAADMVAVQSLERAPYFWNRITGLTTYTKPANYDLINEAHNGGWALVCSEASGWLQYWFHEKSGESCWA